MIRINLLPVKEEKLVNLAKGFLLVVVVVLVSMVALLVANSSVLSGKEKSARTDIQKIDREIASLKTIIGKVNKAKQQNRELQRLLDIIIRLKERNIGPVRVFDELSLKMPSSKIWLDTIQLSGGTLSVDGKTLENKEVADFMKQLESSLFFSNVELKRIQKERVVNGVTLLKYSLKSSVDFRGRAKKRVKKGTGK